MQDGLFARPGTPLAPSIWDAIFELLDAAFPGIAARIRRAETVLGLAWAEVSDPFVWLEGGRPVAHVGLLHHPVRIESEERVIAGIHAVCSHPAHRGRGLVRACMEAALAHVDRAGSETAKLHTDFPDLYARWGFRTAATQRFRWARAGGGGPARRLAPARRSEDANRLLRALRSRRPLPSRFESLDRGWLSGIDACLNELLDRAFVEVQGGLLAATPEEGSRLRIDLVCDEGGLDLARALEAIPEPFDEVVLTLDPGPLAPEAVPEPTPPENGVLMVRGRWPDGPVAISSLWEH